jgi:hypothetical protein
MDSSKRKWWQEPLRVLDMAYAGKLPEFDAETLGKQCQDFHANVVHFHCHREVGGVHPDGIFARSRVATKENRDILSEFIPVAKRYGVRIIQYLDGHWFNKRFVDQHPDWWVIREDGSRVEHLYGDDDSTFCVNSPWRDWMRMRIEDFCQYEIDGFLWDGPVNFLRDKACYCRWCRDKFRNHYGSEMPPWDRSDIENWKLLTEFSVSSLTDYYRDAYQWVKSINPELCVYMNAANVAEPVWTAGRDNRQLMPFTDVLAAEGGFHYRRVLNDPWKTSASSKFYETQAEGKPSINAVSSATGPWRRCQLSGPEMRVLMTNASTGSNPYYAFFVEGLGQAGDAVAREVGAFLEKNQSYYAHTRSAAKVALLCSPHTLSYYAGVDIPWSDISGVRAKKAEAPGNHSRAFYGFYEMLIRARVPFDVIDDVAIEKENLDRYRLVILPTTACMSERETAALVRFVERGGTIIADFETSHYDEWGRRKRELGLAELFGVVSANEVVGPRQWDFAKIIESRDILRHMEIPEIAAPRHNLKVRPTTGQTLAVFSEPIISNIPGPFNYTDEPFLVENRLGKGMSFFFPGTFGELYHECKFPAYARIIENIVKTQVEPDVYLENVSNLIEVNLRDQAEQRRRMIHLVNYEIQPIENVVPARDAHIRVRCPWPVQSVRTLRSSENLSFTLEGEVVRFTVPRLEEFEVIVLDGSE